MSRIGERSSDVVIRREAVGSPIVPRQEKSYRRFGLCRFGIFGTEDNYTVYCCPSRRRTCFSVQRECLRRLHCRLFPQWCSLTPTSAATQTAIIACGLAATTTGTDQPTRGAGAPGARDCGSLVRTNHTQPNSAKLAS
jgi:hypothetical protein